MQQKNPKTAPWWQTLLRGVLGIVIIPPLVFLSQKVVFHSTLGWDDFVQSLPIMGWIYLGAFAIVGSLYFIRAVVRDIILWVRDAWRS